jgi:hypothetical protein
MADVLDSFMHAENFFLACFTFGRGLAYAIYPMKPQDFRNPERSLVNLDQLTFCLKGRMVGRTKVDC